MIDQDRNTRVLVVDDDAVTRMLVRETLSDSGYEVVEASCGREGVEAVTNESIDIIILDLSMPDMDGFEVCRFVRSRPESGSIPVIMLTGSDDVESVETAYECGATDFITKPIHCPLLSYRVRYILRSSRIRAQLEESRTRLMTAQRIAHLGSWSLSAASGMVEVSEEAARIVGRTVDEVSMTVEEWLELVSAEDRDTVMQWYDSVFLGTTNQPIEFTIMIEGTQRRTVCTQGEIVDASTDQPRLIGVLYDVTEWRKAERDLAFRESHDSLTRLETRSRFRDRVEETIARSQRSGNQFAVMVVDLDRFRHINESFGFRFGDDVLQSAAETIQRCCRDYDLIARGDEEPDPFAIGRLGGDAFTIMIEPLEHVHDAARIARRIMGALEKPICIRGRELFLSACVGIVIFPHDEVNAEALLRAAGTALNHAKESGRNSIQFFTPAMNTLSFERLSLETSLRRALERQEFDLLYQPRLNLKTGEVEAVEALVRWRHPYLGLLPPSQFIDIAEEAGLIEAIGNWVLESACRQLRHWLDQGLAPIRIGINVSSIQLLKKRLSSRIKHLSSVVDVPKDLIEVEVSERGMNRNLGALGEEINALMNQGVRVTLDDFGTGQGSLDLLRRFKIHAIKIDKLYIRDLGRKPEASALVQAIISMTRALGIQPIAEGVETEEQRQALLDLGCDSYHGYLGCPPISGDEFIDWMNRRDAASTASPGSSSSPDDAAQ